ARRLDRLDVEPLLVAVVVVDRGNVGDARTAADVAHGRPAEPLLGKHLGRSLQQPFLRIVRRSHSSLPPTKSTSETIISKKCFKGKGPFRKKSEKTRPVGTGRSGGKPRRHVRHRICISAGRGLTGPPRATRPPGEPDVMQRPAANDQRALSFLRVN